jgi:hypothetical protein
LAEKYRRDIPISMKWHRGGPAIGMAVLPVRTALPSLVEAQTFEDGNHLSRLKDRRPRHA